jgi:hypothetical protein
MNYQLGSNKCGKKKKKKIREEREKLREKQEKVRERALKLVRLKGLEH